MYTQQAATNLSKFVGSGFSFFRVPVQWGFRKVEFYVAGVEPDAGGEGDKSAFSAIKAAKHVSPDVALLGLGYLDQENICATFSVNSLISSREIEPVDHVLKRSNGQFIPVIQHLLISGTPCYYVGRDRLVEMGALGTELLWRPGELYSLLWKLIRAKKEKEPVTPSLKRVLSEDSSEFCLWKIHQYLLEWTELQVAHEPLRVSFSVAVGSFSSIYRVRLC